jgi:hypothetical protein
MAGKSQPGRNKPFPLRGKRRSDRKKQQRRASANQSLAGLTLPELEALAREPVQDHLHKRARELWNLRSRPLRARLRKECEALSVEALRARLASGEGDPQVVGAVLREKLLRQLEGMTTPELQAIAGLGGSDWPSDLVRYVLLGRTQTITGDTVKWEEWREQV